MGVGKVKEKGFEKGRVGKMHEVTPASHGRCGVEWSRVENILGVCTNIVFKKNRHSECIHKIKASFLKKTCVYIKYNSLRVILCGQTLSR